MTAFQQASSMAALHKAWSDKARQLRKTCFGVDRIGAQSFEQKLNANLRELNHRLKAKERFRADGLLAIAKKKPNSEKYRIICVPTVGDRVIQFSLLSVLKPHLAGMKVDNPVSFGIAEGVDKSVVGARKFACRARAERSWVYKTDIQQFFDNIDRPTLCDSISKVVRQRSLHPILHSFVDAEISDGFDKAWPEIASRNGIRSGRGVRQGMPLSPLFAGIYLRDFDRRLISWGIPAARYVDDIVAFFPTEKDALVFHKRISDALGDLGLTIGEPNAEDSKTQILGPSQPVEFLGMQLSRNPAGGYRLHVSDDCIRDCASRLHDMGNLEILLEKKVTLTTMGRHFDAVSVGFLSAYSAASNHDKLEAAIKTAANAAQLRLLRDLFGSQRLAALNTQQQRFLGVNREGLLEKRRASHTQVES